MRLSTTFCGLAAVLVAANAPADTLGFGVGGGAWQQSYSGTASDNGNAEFDVEDDLDVDDSTTGYFWAALEHPVPVVPNLRLERSSLDTDGDGRVQRSFAFGGESFTANQRVTSTIELDQTDAVLYYEVLDNVVSLDAGLSIRYFDGRIRLTNETTGDTESRSFSAPAPLAYAAVRVDVPGTGLWLGARGSGVSYSGSRFLDLRGAVGYEFGFGLGVEAGYRRESLEIDDIDDVSADIDVGGAFAGAYLDF